MSDDFFGDLGKSISRATARAVGRTGSLIESTKINAMITAETKSIERLHLELGELVYERCLEEKMTPDEEMQVIIDELKSHLEKILSYRVELAEVRGMRVCPSCGEIIDMDVLFCPKCGVATPSADETENAVLHAAAEDELEEEPDEDDEDDEEETAEESSEPESGDAEEKASDAEDGDPV